MKKACTGAVRNTKGLAAAVAVIASSTLMLVPAGAQATAGPIRSCVPSDRWFTQSLHARGVPCSKARGLEHYAINHGWTPKFRLYRRTWHATIYSRAHGHTYFRIRSGRLIVWLRATGRGLALGSGSSTVSGAPGRLAPPQLQPLGIVTYGQQLPVLVSGPGVAAGQYALIAGSASVIQADSHGQLSFVLPRDVAAGVHPVWLGAPVEAGGGPVPIPGSAPRVLTVRPQLVDVRSVNNGAAVRVQVSPAVQPSQQVALSLIALGGQATTASVVQASSASVPTGTLDFALPTSLPAGQYLCIISVDGVASLPDAQGGVYSGPIVTIS